MAKPRKWTLERTSHENVSVLTDDPGTEHDIQIGEKVRVVEINPISVKPIHSHENVEFDVEYSGDPVEAAQAMDWGIVIKEWQGTAVITIVGESPESAADMLRCAANAVERSAV